jgi:hypothetical protein
MNDEIHLIPLLSIFYFSCTGRPKALKDLDFGVFRVKTPVDWKKVKTQGLDSYMGGLTNGMDSLWFDYGLYDVDLTNDSGYWYRVSEDTVNGDPAIF